MHRMLFVCIAGLLCNSLHAQQAWKNVDTDFGQLPPGFHVFRSVDSLDGKPFKAFYAIADLKEKKLGFTTDTTLQRRLTPTGFYEKNNQPLLVVNTTFFSFATNQNLNLVIKDGRMVGYNIHSLPGKGKDTFTYRHPFNGALGISKKRQADVAWIYSDSSDRYPLAAQQAIPSSKDSLPYLLKDRVKSSAYGLSQDSKSKSVFTKWKMQTAVAGGPVLVQSGQVQISNDKELKFNGKAINDKHPRTLMGYTKDNKLIVMVVEGRNPGISDGVTLPQAAQLLKDLGCWEALNLDGGGSSCMLINGRETIWPSDKGKQRPVPAVLLVTTTTN